MRQFQIICLHGSNIKLIIITCKREMHMVKRLALAQQSQAFDIIQMIQHPQALYRNPFFETPNETKC